MMLLRQILKAFCAGVIGFWLASAQAADGDPARGANKVLQCGGCHGIANYQTAYPEIYRVPKLAGQTREYLVSALNDYRSGARKHPSMRGTANGLSEQDIADIAAFYSQGANK
jgi:cytochrome c553